MWLKGQDERNGHEFSKDGVFFGQTIQIFCCVNAIVHYSHYCSVEAG